MAIGKKVEAALAEKAAKAAAVEIEQPVETVAETAPVAAPAGLDIAAIVQAAVSAALAAGSQNSTDLAKAITDGMAQVKEPIPENKVIDEISELNPLGDRLFPRNGLTKCEMWFGAIDDEDDNTVKRFAEIEPRDASIWELLALNLLEPGHYTITRLDGAPMEIVVDAKIVAGTLARLVIGIPLSVVGKRSDPTARAMVPSITEIVEQVTGYDLNPRRYSATTHRAWLEAMWQTHHELRSFVYLNPHDVKVAA